MTKRTCPRCGGTAALTSHPLRVTRGERSLTVQVPHWECASCNDPETGKPPFCSIDHQQMQEGQDLVDQAWLTQFGEPMPLRKKPGRKPVEPKEERILLTLSQRELRELDGMRGDTPRTAFIREAIAGHLARLSS